MKRKHKFNKKRKLNWNKSQNVTSPETNESKIENETIYNTFKSVSGRAREKESHI